MEYFYRDMRKKYQILMEWDGSPIGGKWNYDKENRKPPVKGLKSPKRIKHKKSVFLKDVLKMVRKSELPPTPLAMMFYRNLTQLLVT